MKYYIIKLPNGFFVGPSGLVRSKADARRYLTRRAAIHDAPVGAQVVRYAPEPVPHRCKPSCGPVCTAGDW